MVKYSIVIPLYNKGEKIIRTIDSVLQQQYENLEIVVVDDGSTDNGADYVKACQDSRIRYVWQANGGVSSARNRGISEAKGEWILLLDADDELLSGSLDMYDKLMKTNPKASVLVQRQNLYHSNGLLSRILFCMRSSYITCFPFWAIWLNLCFPCPRNFCFRKSLCESAGEFDTRMTYWEDFDYTRRVVKHNRMLFTSYIGARYNQEPTGLSGVRHPLNCEMAYYIPEILAKGNTTFWERALLYENIEQEIAWWWGSDENVRFYRDMQRKYFAWYHKYLHWIRAQMIRHKLI